MLLFRRIIMIKYDRVSFKVKGKTIVRNFSLDVKIGEKIVLTGPSGSGKSTILKLLIGAIIPTSGIITFDGHQLDNITIPSIRQKTAYVGQEPILAANSVKEALMLPFTFKAHRNSLPDKKKIFGLLEKLSLNSDILNQNISKISGGEKQRIALVRAMLLNKKIFLLDETTSALDPESKAAVISLLLTSDFTVLSISHDQKWIENCNRIITIENNKRKNNDC